MEVIIKGEAETSFSNLEELDGISCQDDFVEYFDGGLKSKLDSGYLHFKFEADKLWSITRYEVNEKLTEEELDELADYTQGQWSDGIGEGFEQEPCYYDSDDNEVFISPWFFGQKLIVTQN